MTVEEIKADIEIKLGELALLKIDLEEAESSVGVSDKLALIGAIESDFLDETITGKQALYKLELLGL